MYPNPSSSKNKADFLIIESTDVDKSRYDLRGEKIQNIFDEVYNIIQHQFSKEISKGIKGFLFYGEVGTGKTTTAKAIGKALGVPIIFVDGSDIARGLYGHSEQRVKDIFLVTGRMKHSLILIDDSESVFPKRDWLKGQSWHVSQNNVFFHQLDNLNSSQTVVIMTTNRFDLIDKAVIDRVYTIEFPSLDKKAFIEIARDRCRDLGISAEKIIEEIERRSGQYKSVREIEKLVIKTYVNSIKEI